MKFLYCIYQICIALPIFLVLTLLTALVTIFGSEILGGRTTDDRLPDRPELLVSRQ